MSIAVAKKCSFREIDERSCASTSVGDDQATLDDVCSQPSNGGPPCSLVWCHERCHKRENQEVRQALSKAASLVCLKKANKFAAWCQRLESPSYVLLTDWREVKPCMTYLEELPSSHRPLMTIVLCDDLEAKIFARSVQWARSLGAERAVHVVRDLASVYPLLASVEGREPGSGASTPRAGRSKWSRLSSPSKSRQASKAAADVKSPPVRPQEGVRCKFPAPVAPATELTSSPTRTQAGSDRPLLATESRTAVIDYRVEAFVKDIMTPYGSMNMMQLNELLKVSARAPYED